MKNNKSPKAIVFLLVFLGSLLVMPTATEAQGPRPEDLETMGRFIDLMHNYLEVSSRWMSMVAEPETAIYLAAEGITELHEQKGNKARAIPHLRRILERYKDNRAVSNALRFKIRDIYKEIGEYDSALEELERIIESNSQ